MEEESFHFFNLLEWLGFHCDASSILDLVIVYVHHLHCDILMGVGHCGRQRRGVSLDAKSSNDEFKTHHLRHLGYWVLLLHPHPLDLQTLRRRGEENDRQGQKVEKLPPPM